MVCYYCKKEIDINNAVIDYLTPLAQGGKNIGNNMIVICEECENIYNTNNIEIDVNKIIIPISFKRSGCGKYKVQKAKDYFEQ